MEIARLASEKPETEVRAKATRRRFTAKYKLRILKEAAACKEKGELGALLRREGLYSSHLNTWRRQAEEGQIEGLEPKKRGPVAQKDDPKDKKIDELERELKKQKRRAERAEELVALQKKVSEILGIALPENGGEK